MGTRKRPNSMSEKRMTEHDPVSSDVVRDSRRMRHTHIRQALETGQATQKTKHGKTGSHHPPETWYSPTESSSEAVKIKAMKPGKGFVHAVTVKDVTSTLERVSSSFLERLDRIQLTSMTKKKRTQSMYGLQWGSTVYLYPVPEDLTEHFDKPPMPAFRQDTEVYGAKWHQEGSRHILEWTDATVRDYYLNNVLFHELGHINDVRNTSSSDREAYANWFARTYGYPLSDASRKRRGRTSVRRHHRK